ncbi:MAG: hypothetical protein ACKOFT_07580 [Actinomycetota bacterium]
MRIVIAVLVALGVVPGHLGSGDDVRPRDTVSVVQTVTPAFPPGVRVDIVGGDTFLRVRASGHSVTVAGYEDEPYLRISAAGLVEENTASPTSFINTSRYGGTSGSTADAPPVWRTVASDGTVMWHDHRIHWMSPTRPAVINPDGTVLRWEVPVAVDGVVHAVRGTLYLRDRATRAWWAAGLAGIVLAALLARSHRRRYYVAVTAVGAWSALTGFLQWVALPAGARITPLMLVFGAGTALTGAAALVVARRTDLRSDWVASSLAAGAGAAMLVVTWMSYEQVLSAYVPMPGPVWTARANVAVLLGFGIVAVIDGVMRVMRVESDAQ